MDTISFTTGPNGSPRAAASSRCLRRSIAPEMQPMTKVEITSISSFRRRSEPTLSQHPHGHGKPLKRNVVGIVDRRLERVVFSGFQQSQLGAKLDLCKGFQRESPHDMVHIENAVLLRCHGKHALQGQSALLHDRSHVVTQGSGSEQVHKSFALEFPAMSFDKRIKVHFENLLEILGSSREQPVVLARLTQYKRLSVASDAGFDQPVLKAVEVASHEQRVSQDRMPTGQIWDRFDFLFIVVRVDCVAVGDRHECGACSCDDQPDHDRVRE
ncbi:hypothetical protein GQ600_23952 [Phytophthora cactorum]|nr:hypothetical protein GQ600_23952 [Phytophthora cactorum]